ncbi:hypothetical protein [Roseomonas sp. CECT 9278]|uniref:hypothetical protein n=1 Tax=Roseomonas sp. CECT 9278 TaxID=2845823 RepID=UPI001E3FD1C9|nr:hypothetical protein [Roseomonas sp. CECT 9278]CAH0311113.1 hypothetical protein ROS9278_04938 [Roseomonas sp. CECT 9278]
MAKMARVIARIASTRRGVVAAEYAILSVGVVIVVGTAVVILIEPNNSAFRILGEVLLDAQASLAANR